MNLLELQIPEWDSLDAKALRTFLESDVAKKAFSIVSEIAPPLLDGNDANCALVRSGEVKGWHAALAALVDLVNHKPEEAPTPTNYPDIDDDAAWKDAPSPKE